MCDSPLTVLKKKEKGPSAFCSFPRVVEKKCHGVMEVILGLHLTGIRSESVPLYWIT